MKNNKLLGAIYSKRIYILGFFISAVILFIAYALFGIKPFGENSVLVLDLNGQYIYYYEAARDALWGEESMLYSWSRNLSGEMLGIFAYYLASPFMLIVMLLPRTMILYSVLIMQLCKVGTCAVTFSYYLKHSQKSSDGTRLVFSILYALMGYIVVQLMDPMWLDGMIYLPLIVYGVERLIDGKCKVRYIIPLALMFIAHFYIGYMVGFFTAIYFFYYLFFGTDKEDISAKATLLDCWRFFWTTIVAIMCAMAILLPTYYSLSLGKFEFSNPDYSIKFQFTIRDFLVKLLPGTYDTVRVEGLPFTYCGTLTIMLIPAYFANKNIEFRKKVGYGMVLSMLFISMYISTLDICWHGFQVPNWLMYRYSFTFSFILLVMAAKAFERMEGISTKLIGGTTVAMLAFCVYLETQNLKYFEQMGALWISIACIACYGFALRAIKLDGETEIKKMPLVLLVLISGELIGNTLHTFYKINKDVVYSKYDSYVGYIDDGRDLVGRIKTLDDGVYRMEKTFHRTVNDPLAFGFMGLSHSSSTLNSGPIDMLELLGYTSRGHYTKYKGETPLTDDLFGIKYIMTKTKPIYGYDTFMDYCGEMKGEYVTVYINDDALPIMYPVDIAVLNTELSKQKPFENQNKLLSDMLGEGYQEFFHPINISSVDTSTVNSYTAGDHNKYVPKEGFNGEVSWTFFAPEDGSTVFLYMPSNWERKVNLSVNGEYLEDYYETENYSIKTLGRFEPGESVKLTAKMTKEELYIKEVQLYSLDEAALKDAIARLQGNFELTEFEYDKLSGKVRASENQVLFTTIPYESGWTIKVDGQVIDPLTTLDALIAIPVSAGEHTIEMKFFPKELKIGLIISALGIIIVIITAIFERRSFKALSTRLDIPTHEDSSLQFNVKKSDKPKKFKRLMK